MDLGPLDGASGPIHSGANERMPKAHLDRIDADEVCLLGRVECRDVQFQVFCRSDHDLRLARVVRRSEYEQLARGRFERANAFGEEPLDAGGERQGQRQGHGHVSPGRF